MIILCISITCRILQENQTRFKCLTTRTNTVHIHLRKHRLDLHIPPTQAHMITRSPMQAHDNNLFFADSLPHLEGLSIKQYPLHGWRYCDTRLGLLADRRVELAERPAVLAERPFEVADRPVELLRISDIIEFTPTSIRPC